MDISISQILDSPSYQLQKALVAREFQRPLVPVEKDAFKKTQAEKDLLKTFKLNTKVSKRPKTLVKIDF